MIFITNLKKSLIHEIKHPVGMYKHLHKLYLSRHSKLMKSRLLFSWVWILLDLLSPWMYPRERLFWAHFYFISESLTIHETYLVNWIKFTSFYFSNIFNQNSCLFRWRKDTIFGTTSIDRKSIIDFCIWVYHFVKKFDLMCIWQFLFWYYTHRQINKPVSNISRKL